MAQCPHGYAEVSWCGTCSRANALVAPIPSHHRKSWHQYYMTQAVVIAERSTCLDIKVGAIVVSADGVPVSQGYNGAPRGWPHCDEVSTGCDLWQRDQRTYARHVHAEANAIAQAAKVGARLAGATLYVTRMPCPDCLKLIVQAGISRAIYRDIHDDPAWSIMARTLALRSGVTLQSLEEVISLERQDAAQQRPDALERPSNAG